MTREHSRAKREALRLSARLRDSARVVVSHDAACGIHTHKICSCDPIIVVYDAEGEAYLLGGDGRLHRIERRET